MHSDSLQGHQHKALPPGPHPVEPLQCEQQPQQEYPSTPQDFQHHLNRASMSMPTSPQHNVHQSYPSQQPYSPQSPQQQAYPPQQAYPSQQPYPPQSPQQPYPPHSQQQSYPPQSPQQPYPSQSPQQTYSPQYQQQAGSAQYLPYQQPTSPGYHTAPSQYQGYPRPNDYPFNASEYQRGPPQGAPSSHRQSFQGPPSPSRAGSGPKTLFDEYGMATDEFQRYSMAMFNFLDANYAPQNSRAIEQTKLKAFMESLGVDKNRNIAAGPANILEDFYRHFGIPFQKTMAPPSIGTAVNVATKVFKGANFLAGVLGGGAGLGSGGLGGGSSQASLMIPVIDSGAFSTLFANAVKRNPNGMFVKLNEAIQKFRLRVPLLQRYQLPVAPDPMVIEQYRQFEQILMIKMKMKMQQTQMMANLAVQGAHNVQQASLPAGSYYTYK